MILHLVAKSSWDALPADAPYIAPSLATEGFVHCSAGYEQMLAVANNFYRGQPGDFVIIEIDPARLTSILKWEAPAHPTHDLPPEVLAEFEQTAPKFPHVYGPINRDAVVAVRGVTRDAEGGFIAVVAAAAEPASTADAPATHTQPEVPTQAAATPAAETPAAPADPNNPLNLKTPSQMAEELLDATDGFSEALKRYKDRVEARIETLDDDIQKRL
jgi:uncharacterized protein (DUF952 family)